VTSGVARQSRCVAYPGFRTGRIGPIVEGWDEPTESRRLRRFRSRNPVVSRYRSFVGGGRRRSTWYRRNRPQSRRTREGIVAMLTVPQRPASEGSKCRVRRLVVDRAELAARHHSKRLGDAQRRGPNHGANRVNIADDAQRREPVAVRAQARQTRGQQPPAMGGSFVRSAPGYGPVNSQPSGWRSIVV
jgi:hypothetical protein